MPSSFNCCLFSRWRIIKIFGFVTLFWALYEQHASKWLQQADEMRLPDWLAYEQTSAVNAVLILILVPLFNNVIYPVLDKCGVRLQPLRRMLVGFVLTGLSFIVAGALDVVIGYSPTKSVSILWQLPQYVILGGAEVMVSITGLQFAYDESPSTMRGAVMGLWLMTTALGNLLVVVITLLPLPTWPGFEPFLYAGLMLIFSSVFFFVTRTYKYNN